MTPPARPIDAIIAGGGVAGSVVAAALAGLGLDVLVVEPGLDSSKRLAGELIHPPGTADLARFGLLRPLEAAGAVTVKGFAVLADGEAYMLPYVSSGSFPPRGLALEHSQIVGGLHRALTALPHVTVWEGARVTAVEASRPGVVGVTVLRAQDEIRLAARLLVGADGASSPVRRLTGIGAQRHRVSTLVGWMIEGAGLPHPGYGTVFAGGPALALAYHVAPDLVRVIFDFPEGTGRICLDAMPRPFRDEVARAMRARRGLVSASYAIVPDRVAQGRVVLVGDAAGCCHPLTATGFSVCTRDAVRLRDALRADPHDVPAALGRYAVRRAGPERTRLALAEALHEAFAARTPATGLLRRGLLRYWKSSPRGRAASMALLSTQEGRMTVLAREYARVVGYALPDLLTWRDRPGLAELATRGRAAAALTRRTLGYAGAALRTLLALRT